MARLTNSACGTCRIPNESRHLNPPSGRGTSPAWWPMAVRQNAPARWASVRRPPATDGTALRSTWTNSTVSPTVLDHHAASHQFTTTSATLQGTVNPQGFGDDGVVSVGHDHQLRQHHLRDECRSGINPVALARHHSLQPGDLTTSAPVATNSYGCVVRCGPKLMARTAPGYHLARHPTARLTLPRSTAASSPAGPPPRWFQWA